MNGLETILQTTLQFLLQLLELFIGFFIAALQLVLDFARSIVGMAL